MGRQTDIELWVVRAGLQVRSKGAKEEATPRAGHAGQARRAPSTPAGARRAWMWCPPSPPPTTA